MNFAKYRPTRYLKKEDCVPPSVMTIVGSGEIKVSRSASKEEHKPYVDLENDAGEKFRRTMNGQNIETIITLYGEEGDDWEGRDIGVTWNPEVKFNDETTGGIEFVAPNEIHVESAPKKSALKSKLHGEPSLVLRCAEPQPQPANNEEDNGLPY
jgi:hypothetical protein